MPKFSKQVIELRAWQEFELEYLIEPEPELNPHYAVIIHGDDDSLEDYFDLGCFSDYAHRLEYPW